MMSSRLLLPMLCSLFCLLGCGGGEDRPAEREAALVVAETEAEAVGGVEFSGAGNSVTTTDDIGLTPHAEGHFLADWPSGTGRLRTRTVPSNSGAVENAIVRVDCTRDGDMLRGCSVTVWFEVPGGRVPGPDDVTLRLRNVIREHELEIVRQFPIRRDGMEGMTILCKHPTRNRCAWMEGFIDRGRILVVTAWDRDERLYGDPEIRKFVSSVVFSD